MDKSPMTSYSQAVFHDMLVIPPKSKMKNASCMLVYSVVPGSVSILS